MFYLDILFLDPFSHTFDPYPNLFRPYFNPLDLCCLSWPLLIFVIIIVGWDFWQLLQDHTSLGNHLYPSFHTYGQIPNSTAFLNLIYSFADRSPCMRICMFTFCPSHNLHHILMHFQMFPQNTLIQCLKDWNMPRLNHWTQPICSMMFLCMKYNVQPRHAQNDK